MSFLAGNYKENCFKNASLEIKNIIHRWIFNWQKILGYNNEIFVRIFFKKISLFKFYKENYMFLIYSLYKTVDLLLFLFVKIIAWLKGESLKRIYSLIFLTLKIVFEF